MPPQFTTSYLNRTANKWPRRGADRPTFVVWHETGSPNPDNPHGTLAYNLPARIQSSYNYLVARNGEIFHYVDERSWIAYHAGVSSAARGHREWQVNVHSLGVEIDGRNNGEAITPAQRDAAIALMLHFREQYGIPLSRDVHLAHREVAPGYKSDPRGFSVDVLLQLAQQQAAEQQPPPSLGDQLRQRLYERAGGSYHPDWSFHQYARQHRLGVPLHLDLNVTAGGQRFVGEVYARDAIFSPAGQWQTILRLSQLQHAAQRDALSQAAYQALGRIFSPGQAFTTTARASDLGLPLADSARMRVPSGAAYATQPFAFDVLYTPIARPESATRWNDVRRLGRSFTSPAPPAEEAELRDVALRQIYSQIGGSYDPNDIFWRAAVSRGLGLPLAPPQTLRVLERDYTCAVFAGDMVCAPADDPQRTFLVSEI